MDQTDHRRPISPSSKQERRQLRGQIGNTVIKSIHALFRHPGPRRPQDLFRKKASLEGLPISSNLEDHGREGAALPPISSFRPLPPVPSSLHTQPDSTRRHSMHDLRRAETPIGGGSANIVVAKRFLKDAYTKLKPNKKQRARSQVDLTADSRHSDVPLRFFVDDYEVIDQFQLENEGQETGTADRHGSGFWPDVMHAMRPVRPSASAGARSARWREETDVHVPLFVSGNLLKEFQSSDNALERDGHTVRFRSANAQQLQQWPLRPALGPQDDHNDRMTNETRPKTGLNAAKLAARLEEVQRSLAKAPAVTSRPTQPPVPHRFTPARVSLAARMMSLSPTPGPKLQEGVSEGKRREREALDLETSSGGSHQVGQDSTTRRDGGPGKMRRHRDGITWPSLPEQSVPFGEPLSGIQAHALKTKVMPQLGHSRYTAEMPCTVNSAPPSPPPHPDLAAIRRHSSAPTSSTCTYSSDEVDVATADSRILEVCNRVQEWRARVATTPTRAFFSGSATNSHLDDLLQIDGSSHLTSISRVVQIGQSTGREPPPTKQGSIGRYHPTSHFSQSHSVVDADRSQATKEDVVHSAPRPQSAHSVRPQCQDQSADIPGRKSAARISFHGSPDDLIKLFRGAVSFEKKEEQVSVAAPDLLADMASDRDAWASSLPYGTSHIKQLSVRDSEALMEIFERSSGGRTRDGADISVSPSPSVPTLGDHQNSRQSLEHALDRLSLFVDQIGDIKELHRAFLQVQKDILHRLPGTPAADETIARRLMAIEHALFVPA